MHASRRQVAELPNLSDGRRSTGHWEPEPDGKSTVSHLAMTGTMAVPPPNAVPAAAAPGRSAAMAQQNQGAAKVRQHAVGCAAGHANRVLISPILCAFGACTARSAWW